ncbi:MAG TPA: amidohydrolase family protein, partial [Vicinamibacterales bacterium]|nr:amidohydrolase family protein [Vicinamibacterales bacterium]
MLNFTEPARIDRAIDLSGTWVVPPFAEAHNHNIDGAVEQRSLAAIRKYAADGVFYVKIQGNYALTDEQRRRLPINRPGAPDVAFAQAFITATGGHPTFLHEEILLRQGYYPGLTKEGLRDKVYFTIDTERDLDATWPRILAIRPDFIKTNLWYSDEFERRRNDPAFIGRKGLDPRLLRLIVERAHAGGLRVSAHVVNGADFRNAVNAGVDEIVHVPAAGVPAVEQRMAQVVTNALDEAAIRQISAELAQVNSRDPSTLPLHPDDARLAAKRGTVVITTMSPSTRAPAPLLPLIRAVQSASLRTLIESGVTIAIGSDNVGDSSVLEAEHLHSLGVFGNLALLKLWTEDTPRAIFPQRRIGFLREGYEASFLALEGDPLDDWRNVRRIKLRFKQGVEVD